MTEEVVAIERQGDKASAPEARVLKAKKRGLFPRLPLKSVLELPEAMFRFAEGEPVRRLTLMDRMGRSPDSGTTRTLITAANSGYGLVKGGYTAEYLELSDRGKRIIAASDEPSRYQAAYEALFSNEILASFIQRFSQRSVPNPEVGGEYLKKTFGLSSEDAQACYEIMQQNLMDWGLVRELSGRTVIVSQEMGLESVEAAWRGSGRETLVEPEASSARGAPARPLGQEVGSKQGAQAAGVAPQFHFNIQVHLPADGTPEVYEAIFKSIAVHLLGRDQG